MSINLLNNFKKKRARINDMQAKSHSKKAKNPDQGQCSHNNCKELCSEDNMLLMSNRPEKKYKNYGLLNITQNDLSSIPLSLYNPVIYLRRREMGYNTLSRVQPLSLRYLLRSFVSTDNDIYKCNDEEQSAIIPPFACRYNNGRDHKKLLAIADEIGNVRIINTEKEGEIELKTQWLAHENAIFDIAWSLDDKKLITAGGDQTALLWDIETNKCLSGFQGHVSSIKSIVFHNTNPFICASGAREGSIMIWDLRCTGTVNENGDYIHKPANIIRNAHVPVTSNFLKKKKDKTNQHIGVAAVHFLNKPGYLASAGTADGLIKFWDIRSNGSYLHRSNPVPAEVSIPSNHSKRPHGFSSLSLNSTGKYLFSACTDNSIYMYNTLNLGKPIYRFTSPTYKCSTFYIKTSISPDNRFIASGSSDNHVYIWDITAPHRSPVKLKGHENEVTAVSWCPIDIKQMVTCSDDTSIRIWNMNEELENKCKNDLFLKTTWGHAIEDIPVETREDTPSTQVNKENISNVTNNVADSNNSPSTSFFNFPNTISYSYDSNDNQYSSSPLSRYKYQNNTGFLEDEASTSTIPSRIPNSVNRTVSTASIASTSTSTIPSRNSNSVNRTASIASTSTSTIPSRNSNSVNRTASTASTSTSIFSSSSPAQPTSNSIHPFYIPHTPTKDTSTPSRSVHDSSLSPSITDYFSTLSTKSPKSPISTRTPTRNANTTGSKRKLRTRDISLSFLKNNESSVSFIMPNEKSNSTTTTATTKSNTISSFASSPLSKKSTLVSTSASFNASSSSSSSASPLSKKSTLSKFTASSSASPLSKKSTLLSSTSFFINGSGSSASPLSKKNTIPKSTASSSASPLSKKMFAALSRSKSASSIIPNVTPPLFSTITNSTNTTTNTNTSSTTSTTTSTTSTQSSPKNTNLNPRLRHSSPLKKSTCYYNQPTLQESFSSLSNSSSSPPNFNFLNNSNTFKKSRSRKMSSSDISSMNSTSLSAISPSPSSSPILSATTSHLNSNALPRLEPDLRSSLMSSSPILKSSSSLSIVSPPSSPCASAPSSPFPTARRKRTLMDYFSPNTERINKKQKAKAIETSDEEEEEEEEDDDDDDDDDDEDDEDIIEYEEEDDGNESEEL